MSFGDLNTILKKTSKFIEKNITNNNINKTKKQAYDMLQLTHPDITMNIVDEIFNRLYSTTFTFNKW